MMEKVNDTDEYIAGCPENVREKLVQLRATIRENAPEAKEVISYQMPAYKQNGILCYFAAHTNHIGFYPGVSAIEAFKSAISGYKWSKGTIQFPLDKPLPLDLIAGIIRFRVLEKSVKPKKK